MTEMSISNNDNATSSDTESSAKLSSESLADPRYLEEIRQQMLKFALLQLNEQHLAEDAVQEALLGAMKNAKAFSGKAALKTWIFAILRNKIADILRKRHRQAEISSSQLNFVNADEQDDDMGELFDVSGKWTSEEMPVEWQNPEASFKQEQFWQVFEICLNNLPGRQARVFMMREYIGLDSDEICVEADLTTSNLHVLLYRARLRLQKCLESQWLKGEAVHA